MESKLPIRDLKHSVDRCMAHFNTILNFWKLESPNIISALIWLWLIYLSNEVFLGTLWQLILTSGHHEKVTRFVDILHPYNFQPYFGPGIIQKIQNPLPPNCFLFKTLSGTSHGDIQWLSLVHQELLRQKLTKPFLFSGGLQGSYACLEVMQSSHWLQTSELCSKFEAKHKKTLNLSF